MTSSIAQSASGGAPLAAPKDALKAHVSAVIELVQDSPFMFASPLGPFWLGERSTLLPRFVFFGPHASQESWRLAILAGVSGGDYRSSHALLALAERLYREAETGHGLHLALFPVVDASALYLDEPDRRLGSAHWGRSQAPEIALLEKDCRLKGYDGFIRVETAPEAENLATLRIRGSAVEALSPDLELISTEETGPVPIRFELADGPAESGPLSVADDLPLAPFELTLSLPASWPDVIYQNAVGLLLQRFLWRYRAFQAYAQHL